MEEVEPPNALLLIDVSAIVLEFAPVVKPVLAIGTPVRSESLRANVAVGGGLSMVKVFSGFVQVPTQAWAASTNAANTLDEDSPNDVPPGVNWAVFCNVSRMVSCEKSPTVRVAPPSLVRMKPVILNKDSA